MIMAGTCPQDHDFSMCCQSQIVCLIDRVSLNTDVNDLHGILDGGQLLYTAPYCTADTSEMEKNKT
jgi:hypothetical protein